VKDGKRIPFDIQALQYFINNQVIDLKMNEINARIHPIDISVL
jgi:hypothetical protein